LRTVKPKTVKILFFLFVCVSCAAFSQQHDVDLKIREVFNNDAESLVFSDNDRLAFYSQLINQRVEFAQAPQTTDEKYPRLSQCALLNKYNSYLQRDEQFDPATFNILKYDLSFTSQHTVVYRVDNTDWLLIIHPQKKN
jgi:parvulin-like peptidyl-prolyl isomerase